MDLALFIKLLMVLTMTTRLSLECVFLTIVFSNTLINGQTSRGLRTVFGCPFKTSGDKVYQIGDTPNTKPVWGNEPVIPFVFKNVTLFKKFRDFIHYQISDSVRNNINLNNIDYFIQFYRDYDHYTKSHPSSKFELFYNRYRCKFQSTEEFSIRSLEVLQILGSYPMKGFDPESISKSIYLSAVSLTARVRDLNAIEERPPTDKHYGHTLATMKFIVREKNRRDRMGYFLIESGGGNMLSPVVVMEDGQNPHTGEMILSDTQVNFQLLPDTDYIFSRPLNYTDESIKYLIYVGKPYCSLLDTTLKVNLLDPTKYLLRQNGNGDLVAGISFKALRKNQFPPNEQSIWPSLTLFVNNGLGEQMVIFPMSLIINFKESGNMVDILEWWLQTISGHLQINVEDFYSKIVEVHEICKDKRFMDGISKIRNKMTFPNIKLLNNISATLGHCIGCV